MRRECGDSCCERLSLPQPRRAPCLLLKRCKWWSSRLALVEPVDSPSSEGRLDIAIPTMPGRRSACGLARKWQAMLVLLVLSWILLAFRLRNGRPGGSGAGESNLSPPVDKCQGKRVFMYELPRELNVGLLERCDGQLVGWLNLCPRSLNWGLGQLLDFGNVAPESALFSDSFAHRVSPASDAEMQTKAWDPDSIATLSEDGPDSGTDNWTCVTVRGGSWFATDVYMLEMVFHKRMMHYPCLTEDPALASLFYLPYYGGMDALQYIFGNKTAQFEEHGNGLIQFLEEHPSMRLYWKRHGGHDHFLVPGRVGWDYWRLPGQPGWGTNLYLQPQLVNVTFLVLESRGEWSGIEQAVPYPTSFHPPLVRRRGGSGGRGLGMQELRDWKRKVRSSRRSSLYALAAGRRYPLIREILINQCLESNSGSSTSSDPSNTDWSRWTLDAVCQLVNCSKIQCGHNPQPVADIFLHSDFCLQPPGDTPTRRSTFDSIITGCIPVFFTPMSAYIQYTWHLPEDRGSYSVFIPEEDVRQGKKVEDVLRNYTKAQVTTMRQILMSLLPRVMYLDFVDDAVTNPSIARCDGSSPSTDQLEQVDDLEPIEDAFDISVKGLLAKVDAYKAQHF